ncbi:MAG: type II 3-dehydroquinate dehydratase [Kangiellaceae bacterium]|nr:type II 3-dehydroquinate dehydratase [Kangiellaceae bacterium]
MKILVINGPNLNLLGTREPDIYGSLSLDEINNQLNEIAANHSVELESFQSNAEHEVIDCVQAAGKSGIDFILINPAAFTHTSVAIRDAIAAVAIPFIEIHLSNPHSREPFRKYSYFSDLAIGVIAGFGIDSYLMALNIAIKNYKNSRIKVYDK